MALFCALDILLDYGSKIARVANVTNSFTNCKLLLLVVVVVKDGPHNTIRKGDD